MEKEYKMSQARKDELEQELNYLKTTRSDEVAEQIKIAAGSATSARTANMTRQRTSRASSTPGSPSWK